MVSKRINGEHVLIHFQINFFHFNPMKNLGKPPLKKKNKDNFEDFHDIRWIYMSGKSGKV